MLFGEVGLMLLVLEAGLDVDFEMLKLIGLRGIASGPACGTRGVSALRCFPNGGVAVGT